MTLARISWKLPPEELSEAAYIPSLWTVQKMALLILISAVLGPLSLADLNRVYFENRSFSSSGSRWSLTQRRSATA
jgi:hypothetical protein